MLKPSPAELLVGVADALDQTVLGSMDRGPERNQVQAAIGIVRRCAAAIAVHGPLLYAECSDLTSTLRSVAAVDTELLSDRASFEQVLARADAVLASVYPSQAELTEAVSALRDQAAVMAVLAERRASAGLPEIRCLLKRMLGREEALGLSPW
jgi:hypothetical protein